MPNKNSYTSMKNHQVLNNHPNEAEADKCKWCNKHKFPLSNSYKKKKKKNYQTNIDYGIAGYNQNCYLGSS